MQKAENKGFELNSNYTEVIVVSGKNDFLQINIFMNRINSKGSI